MDLSQDDLDAAMNVVKDKSEIRKVLEAWDSLQGSKLFGTGKLGLAKVEGLAEAEKLPDEGTAMEMQLEVAKEGGLGKNPKKGAKGEGKGKKKMGAAMKKMSSAGALSKKKK